MAREVYFVLPRARGIHSWNESHALCRKGTKPLDCPWISQCRALRSVFVVVPCQARASPRLAAFSRAPYFESVRNKLWRHFNRPPGRFSASAVHDYQPLDGSARRLAGSEACASIFGAAFVRLVVSLADLVWLRRGAPDAAWLPTSALLLLYTVRSLSQSSSCPGGVPRAARARARHTRRPRPPLCCIRLADPLRVLAASSRPLLSARSTGVTNPGVPVTAAGVPASPPAALPLPVLVPHKQASWRLPSAVGLQEFPAHQPPPPRLLLLVTALLATLWCADGQATVTVLAGDTAGTIGPYNKGHADGTGTAASFDFPVAAALTANGSLALVVSGGSHSCPS